MTTEDFDDYTAAENLVAEVLYGKLRWVADRCDALPVTEEKQG